MSLDVYIRSEYFERDCECVHCGNIHKCKTYEQFYSANITHNLGEMAEAAGIYHHLWHPEDIDCTHAGQIIEPIKTGLAVMIANPEYFRQFEAKNRWGTYDVFVSWIKAYLVALAKHPNARIVTST